MGLEDPIEKGTLRMRADEGILDLPTVCSSDYEGSGYFLTCQSLVLSHEAKELAKTAYLRLDTPSKNFDMKPDNGCSRILSGINQSSWADCLVTRRSHSLPPSTRGK